MKCHVIPLGVVRGARDRRIDALPSSKRESSEASENARLRLHRGLRGGGRVPHTTIRLRPSEDLSVGARPEVSTRQSTCSYGDAYGRHDVARLHLPAAGQQGLHVTARLCRDGPVVYMRLEAHLRLAPGLT